MFPITTHRLMFQRPKGTGTFAPSDILRAVLAVIDLEGLTMPGAPHWQKAS